MAVSCITCVSAVCRLAFANLLNFAVWRKNPHANDVEPARDQKPLKGDDYGPTGPAGRPVRAARQPAKRAAAHVSGS